LPEEGKEGIEGRPDILGVEGDQRAVVDLEAIAHDPDTSDDGKKRGEGYYHPGGVCCCCYLLPCPYLRLP